VDKRVYNAVRAYTTADSAVLYLNHAQIASGPAEVDRLMIGPAALLDFMGEKKHRKITGCSLFSGVLLKIEVGIR